MKAAGRSVIRLSPETGRECGCHRFGHLEAEAACSAIVDRARRAIYQGRQTVLAEMESAQIFWDITPAMIAMAADSGDDVALEVMQETRLFRRDRRLQCDQFPEPGDGGHRRGHRPSGTGALDPIMRTVRANALVEALEVCKVVPSEVGVTMQGCSAESCSCCKIWIKRLPVKFFTNRTENAGDGGFSSDASLCNRSICESWFWLGQVREIV